MNTEITIPDIGDDSLAVIEVLVKTGDIVKKEQPLFIIESDKAAIEVPAESDGAITILNIKVGDKVKTGDKVGEIATAQSETKATATPAENTDTKQLSSEQSKQNNAATPINNSNSSATIDIVAPDIGDEALAIIEILAKVGDTVAADEALMVLESDKAAVEITSPESGILKSLSYNIGDKVSSGKVIGTLQLESNSKVAIQNPAQQTEKVSKNSVEEIIEKLTIAPKTNQSITKTDANINNEEEFDNEKFKASHASPSARKFARELGVDLGKIIGSGRKGRVSAEDIKRFVKIQLSTAPTVATASTATTGIPAIPAVDFTKFGAIEQLELNRINQLTGANLSRNWLNIPHVTQHDEADITDLENFRQSLKSEAEKAGIRITMLAFLMKTLVAAMKEYPRFNSSLSPDQKSLILKKYFNVGIAVDTANGLVVPVIKDVDKKGIFELSSDLMKMSKKAKDGKLLASDMQGGCITISSLGGIGGTYFTPIVNAPEVAILGVSKSRIQPVYNSKEFVPRNILPISLSYDHRVIDGAEGARFTRYIATTLANIERLIL